MVTVALIDEDACIGCALCIPACPVDAIVGAQKFMHTVIAAECTGCRRCLPPCPVDCISMVETGETSTHEERVRRAGQYRRRHLARKERLERAERVAAGRDQAARTRKSATIGRVVELARQRLQQRTRRT